MKPCGMKVGDRTVHSNTVIVGFRSTKHSLTEIWD
jgi:hypothetical protein